MNHVYIIMNHHFELDQLLLMEAWLDETEAEKVADSLRKHFGYPPKSIEVRCIRAHKTNSNIQG